MNMLNEGKPDAAIYYFKLARQADPDYPYSYYNLGLAYLEEGRDGEAINEFKEAIRLKPDYVKAYATLGWVYYKQGAYDIALKNLWEAISIDPDYAEGYYRLGEVYLAKGLYSVAARQYDEALEIEPGYAEAQAGLDKVNKLIREARLADVRETMEEPAGSTPLPSASDEGDQARGHYKAGISYIKAENFDLATREFQEAIRLRPDYAEAYDRLGSAYVLMEQNDLAKEMFKEAIRLKPGYVSAYENLGIVYYNEGQYALAMAYNERASELRGDDTVPFLSKLDFLGLKAKLAANKGKVIILDFWVNDCPNCQKSEPFMNSLYNKYNEQGLLVIGLFADKDQGDARTFLSAAGTKYPTFVADDTIMEAYSLKRVPYYVYIDRNGEVRGKDVGFFEDQRGIIEGKVIELLEESG
ncbi:MAG: tetratricopeptide repeat protein [Planctomycetes bacterium]|nr:tetratricopeptide repeat protein [Planctomycetota bacterium]